MFIYIYTYHIVSCIVIISMYIIHQIDNDHYHLITHPRGPPTSLLEIFLAAMSQLPQLIREILGSDGTKRKVLL